LARGILIGSHKSKEVPTGFPLVCCVCKIEGGIQMKFHETNRLWMSDILGIPNEEVSRKGGQYRMPAKIATCQDK
jgi:hypothetical protein